MLASSIFLNLNGVVTILDRNKVIQHFLVVATTRIRNPPCPSVLGPTLDYKPYTQQLY